MDRAASTLSCAIKFLQWPSRSRQKWSLRGWNCTKFNFIRVLCWCCIKMHVVMFCRSIRFSVVFFPCYKQILLGVLEWKEERKALLWEWLSNWGYFKHFVKLVIIYSLRFFLLVFWLCNHLMKWLMTKLHQRSFNFNLIPSNDFIL
jgi:hypothetical protein